MTDRTRTAKDDAPAAKTPRTKPAEVRLDELMAAAEKLFLAQGVEATTISEIVEHAQVAKGTFYHYFDSKADMLAALAQRYTASFLERLQQAVDACDADDWLGRLRAWIRASIDTYAATYRTHDIVYTNHHHHDRANPDRNAILDQLREILEGGAQAGAWRLAHPQVTALLIYAGVHGATDHLIASPQTDRHAFVEAVVGDCLRMLGIEDPARRRA
ncbi:TetR/AcrR family transcriptional regulator [Burkholderia pseudomultivorans]|uniref:TetR family transcriptional regulator n=1 Tax=Burkholderia pseudomultivorans TaxID=1207504 RepID=A0A132EPF7_9BURK|nr:TetR/AcrR family transcriptional regulator [Burkholderia pseudomultivorans]KWF55795.1 TetR family transcriptional regulator [Burkholderia pseudomultivorans]